MDMMPANALRDLTGLSVGTGAEERKGEGGGALAKASTPTAREAGRREVVDDEVGSSSASGERGWEVGLLLREELCEVLGREEGGLGARGAAVVVVEGAEVSALESVLDPDAGTGESRPRSPRKSATSFARLASAAARRASCAGRDQSQLLHATDLVPAHLISGRRRLAGGWRVDWLNEILGVVAARRANQLSESRRGRESGNVHRKVCHLASHTRKEALARKVLDELIRGSDKLFGRLCSIGVLVSHSLNAKP